MFAINCSNAELCFFFFYSVLFHHSCSHHSKCGQVLWWWSFVQWLTQLFFFFFLSSASLALPILEWLAALLILDILSDECCRRILRSATHTHTQTHTHTCHVVLCHNTHFVMSKKKVWFVWPTWSRCKNFHAKWADLVCGGSLNSSKFDCTLSKIFIQ